MSPIRGKIMEKNCGSQCDEMENLWHLELSIDSNAGSTIF